jgi:hypothetical protein
MIRGPRQAREQPVAPRRYRHQSWPAAALGNVPVLLFECPTAPSARRDNFQPGNLRNRRMVSHTPMSSLSITPHKAAFAGAILSWQGSPSRVGYRLVRDPLMGVDLWGRRKNRGGAKQRDSAGEMTPVSARTAQRLAVVAADARQAPEVLRSIRRQFGVAKNRVRIFLCPK